jgi:hypothetical protein
MDSHACVILRRRQVDSFLKAGIARAGHQDRSGLGVADFLDGVLVKAGAFAHNMHELPMRRASRILVIGCANGKSAVWNSEIELLSLRRT